MLPEATEQCCARDIARKLIPYVQAQLPSMLANIKFSPWVPIPDLAAQHPLPIPFVAGQRGVGASSSYKEPWVPAHCYVSCRDSGLYEAGGNLCWVDAEVGGQTTVPCIFPSWQSVVTTAETCFNPAQPDATQQRILFPVPLTCFARSGVSATDFPRGGLVLLGGHVFVFAWYVSVFWAMEASNTALLRMLFECALTTSIKLIAVDDPATLAVHSIRMSEVVMLSSKAAADSFVTFARKLAFITKLDLKECMKHNLRYNGAPINSTMVQVILNLRKVCDPEVVTLFASLEREFGVEVVTGSYNKLKYLLNAVKCVPESLAWVLETMLVGLRRGSFTAEHFTCTAFSSSRKGQPTFINKALAQMCIVKHLVTATDNVAAVENPVAEIVHTQVLSKLCSPLKFDSGSALPETAPRGVVLFREILKRAFAGDYTDVQTLLAFQDTPTELPAFPFEQEEMKHRQQQQALLQ